MAAPSGTGRASGSSPGGALGADDPHRAHVIETEKALMTTPNVPAPPPSAVDPAAPWHRVELDFGPGTGSIDSIRGWDATDAMRNARWNWDQAQRITYVGLDAGDDIDLGETPSPADRFRQEPSRRAGSSIHHVNSGEENPMLDQVPSPVVTFTAPGELMARMTAADEAESTAALAAIEDGTAENYRTLAAVRRDLADAYEELARKFCESFVVFLALRAYANKLRVRADGDDEHAAFLEARVTGGEKA
jgi:hypothetical protein